MMRFIMKRCVAAAVALLLMSVLIFVLVRLVGDPAHLMMPPEATEADRALFREQLGLNDPIFLQYWKFALRALHGDFGDSFHFGVPALRIVLDRLAPSLILTVSALFLATFVGITLGVRAATTHSKILQHGIALFAALGQSAPPFFFALLFIRLFSVELAWLPTGGYGSWQHLVLPMVALGWYSAAGITRLTSANMQAVLTSEYIKMARIKGVPEKVVVLHHGLKNAALPVFTFAASQFGILIGGAVAVEAVCSWPGFGSLMVESIDQLDFTVVQAAVIISTFLFILINLIVDLAYALIDPRISHE